MTRYRIPLLLALLSLGAACTSGSNSDDPVECTETCDANASCNDVGGEGACECNTGYTGDGLTCEEDLCAGLTLCTSEGTSCSADSLVICAANADGCLVESSQDCTASEQICDDSGETAVCVSGCTTDPACTDRSAGEGFCDGSTPVTCDDTNSDGCLEPVSGSSCGQQVCDDSGAAPVCVANGTGDSCASTLLVQSDASFTGTDITADFTDLESFDGASCVATNGGAAAVDAVFSANLLAGQTVSLSEFGGADVVMGILPTCDSATACYAGVDGVSAATEEAGISYTATADETVFLYVTTFFEAPSPADYDIRIAFSECGNGLVEANEACDDNNVDNDGCTACTVDQGFTCDNGSGSSVCTGPTDLGSFAAATAIPDTVESLALGLEESHFYSITFTNDVLLSGTLDATNAEDIDFFLLDAAGDEVVFESTTGGETWTDNLVLAGTYLIEVNAFEAIAAGWTLSMSTTAAPAPTDLGSFAAADAITDTIGGPLTGETSDHYLITFATDVVLDGTLSADTGDVDLFVSDASGPVFSSLATGDETFAETLTAGTYSFQVKAFGTTDINSYTLSMSTTAP